MFTYTCGKSPKTNRTSPSYKHGPSASIDVLWHGSPAAKTVPRKRVPCGDPFEPTEAPVRETLRASVFGGTFFCTGARSEGALFVEGATAIAARVESPHAAGRPLVLPRKGKPMRSRGSRAHAGRGVGFSNAGTAPRRRGAWTAFFPASVGPIKATEAGNTWKPRNTRFKVITANYATCGSRSLQRCRARRSYQKAIQLRPHSGEAVPWLDRKESH